MHNDSEALLDSIVDTVCKRRGKHFISQKESQQYLEQTKSEVLELIQQGDAMLIEGLHILEDCRGGHVRNYVSDTAALLLANLGSPKKLARTIEKIWQNENSLLFFNDVIDSYTGCGDFEKEHRLIVVYMALFPCNPQPYIALGSLIWRRDGIAAAENYYFNVADAINNPVLDYFAAECFYKSGNKSRAKETLKRALVTAEKSPDEHSDTSARLQEFLEKCSQ
jgi:tetratricopeptide (TPR) repeat protein